MIRLPHASAAIVLLLALAACGGKDEEGNNSSGAAAMQSDADTPPANSQNAVTPMVPQPSPSPVVSGIPREFHGRWGMTFNDCVPGRADAKGLMIVSADGLGFYESRGAIEKVVTAIPNTLTLDISFSGEGQQWNRRETLTIMDGGKTLVRNEQNPPGSFRYDRCPDGKEEQPQNDGPDA